VDRVPPPCGADKPTHIPVNLPARRHVLLRPRNIEGDCSGRPPLSQRRQREHAVSADAVASSCATAFHSGTPAGGRVVDAAGDLLETMREQWLHLRGGGGIFLANGARFYLDQGKPEFCTPECTDPWAVVRYVRAGERMLESAAADLMRRYPPSYLAPPTLPAGALGRAPERAITPAVQTGTCTGDAFRRAASFPITSGHRRVTVERMKCCCQ
jgi:hypothetical protein